VRADRFDAVAYFSEGETVLFVLAYLLAQAPEFIGLGTKSARFRPVGLGRLLSGPLPAGVWYALLAVLVISGELFAGGSRRACPVRCSRQPCSR
jgi:hypothetical protein